MGLEMHSFQPSSVSRFRQESSMGDRTGYFHSLHVCPHKIFKWTKGKYQLYIGVAWRIQPYTSYQI